MKEWFNLYNFSLSIIISFVPCKRKSFCLKLTNLFNLKLPKIFIEKN